VRQTRAAITAAAVTFLAAAGAGGQDARQWEAFTRDLLESSAQERYVDPSNPALEAQVKAIAADLRCPVCQGLSLQDSPTELAQQIRAVIREQLQSGKTPEEVRAYFVDKYGEWILLAPAPHGFNLVAYILPFAVLLAGGAMLAVAVRRWSAPGPGAQAGDLEPEEEEELRV
jgi:cytochrome c-type biogenesis protein CcmH/NrfF